MSNFKLVSYNINNSRRTKDIVNNIFNFAKLGVSVFCLQEVRPHDHQFIGDSILKQLGDGWQAEFFLGANPKSYDYGLAIIWKTDVLQVNKFEKIFFPMLKKAKFYEKVFEFIKGKGTTLTQRGALIGTFSHEGKTLRIIDIHLDWQGGFDHRLMQFDYLMKYLDLEAGPTDQEVICGDFNSLGVFGNRAEIEKIQTILGAEFMTTFPKFTVTTTHMQHLDHIFARNIRIEQGQVFSLRGSDHYPILAHLSN